MRGSSGNLEQLLDRPHKTKSASLERLKRGFLGFGNPSSEDDPASDGVNRTSCESSDRLGFIKVNSLLEFLLRSHVTNVRGVDAPKADSATGFL